jgi:hypothetical protein
MKQGVEPLKRFALHLGGREFTRTTTDDLRV